MFNYHIFIIIVFNAYSVSLLSSTRAEIFVLFIDVHQTLKTVYGTVIRHVININSMD